MIQEFKPTNCDAAISFHICIQSAISFHALFQVSLVLKSIFTSDSSYDIVKGDIGKVDCGNNGKNSSLPLTQGRTDTVALVARATINFPSESSIVVYGKVYPINREILAAYSL